MPLKSSSKQAASAATAASSAKIVATSQTSRFHTETLETLSTEIDVHQVNISIGKRDLLVDAHLRLKSDVCYGLVGRNGEGKSTLLKAITEKLIPGIPENLRILLVGQTESLSETSSPSLDKAQPTQSSQKVTTVLETVVQSDKIREEALKELSLLNAAVESASEDEARKALAIIKYARAAKELEIAEKTAKKRSGARGAEARKALLASEAKMADTEKRLSDLSLNESKDSNRGEQGGLFAQLQALIEEVQEKLDAMNASATEATARTILLGLGFSQAQLDSRFESLSGGWRSRCSLASALVQKPNLLILDEPTNYLDIPSVIWLERYLLSLTSTTILIVAHDRDFLDNVTTETIVLRNQTLKYYEGSVSDYERAARKNRKHKLREKDALDKKRALVEKSIAENAKLAQRTGDDKKARMVKTWQKRLDERWGSQVNEKGHRFKLNRDMAGYHLSNRSEVSIDEIDPPVTLPIPDPEPMRFPGSLCSATDVSFRYSKNGPWILEDVNIAIHPGARIALVGKNGQGKSTLVKLLVGQMRPTKGAVGQHSRLKLGYYSQHSVEELSVKEVAGRQCLEYFMQRLEESNQIQLDEGTARSFLGAFGLKGQTATHPIGALSGGQKVRLALALIVYPAPDLLVLDEVSTHLDMDTTAALIRALRRFAGGILVVSHDRHLVRCLVEGAPLYKGSDASGDDQDDSEDSELNEEDDPTKIRLVYRVGPKGKVKTLRSVDEYVQIVERRMAR